MQEMLVLKTTRAEGLTISGKRIAGNKNSGETNKIGTEGDKISQVKGQKTIDIGSMVFCIFF